MSVDAINEYLYLWNTLRDYQLIAEPDRTVWRWTQDSKFSVKSAYTMLHTGTTAFLGHKYIWKTWASLKIKIFLWLTFRRRHWTGDRRWRHSLEAREECYLCEQGRKTINHILSQCLVTMEVWYHALTALGKQCPQPAKTTIAWWRRLRSMFHGDQRKGLDSLFALISWGVCKERNARCFRESVENVSNIL